MDTNTLEIADNLSTLQKVVNQEYKYGFKTEIEKEYFPRGLNEDIILKIIDLKDESFFLSSFRKKSYDTWKKMELPTWANLPNIHIDFNKITYYSSPKKKKKIGSLDELDPAILKTFEKLGIPLDEQKRLSNVAVDAVFDSISVATTFQDELAKYGVIFCPISEAIKYYPHLVKKFLGTVVPPGDNFFTALNSAVFSDGSFCYIPKNTKCPLELSTYFRINDKESGQFERTLIIAENNSYVSYLEGCTAPQYDENQLHAAIVELIAMENATIKYSTVQNWYSGNEEGVGGIYNFVTKRGLCLGKKSRISWTQVETGSAITWKYPSCILLGEESTGEFYSVAVTNNFQKADTGTKMIHLGSKTKSTIISKGISNDYSQNTYRGLTKISPKALFCKNYSQCDSLLIGENSIASTNPYICVANSMSSIEHEATTSRIGEEQIFYFQQRGIDAEQAMVMMVSGFCKQVFTQLPMEFALEASKLLGLKLNGVG
jgi:Fe-S cluster assembly protein SufB